MTAVEITPPEAISAIAEQNDLFRKGMTDLRTRYQANDKGIKGRYLISRSVQACGIATQAMELVSQFEAFTPDNDPHGEHDWGTFKMLDEDGDEKTINWKIDYYSDTKFEWGSEDPSNVAKTARLLTVMLMQEA